MKDLLDLLISVEFSEGKQFVPIAKFFAIKKFGTDMALTDFRDLLGAFQLKK